MSAVRTVLILTVALSLAVAPLAAAGPAAPKRYNDPRMKISFALPSDWIYETVSGSYVFSGPKGTASYDSEVSIQFVNRSTYPTLDAQARNLEQGVEKVLERKKGTFAKYPATRVRVLMVQQGHRLQKEFLVVERGDMGIFYVLGYSADPRIYAKYYPIYSEFLKSVSFIK